jgi:hypothetical protein
MMAIKHTLGARPMVIFRTPRVGNRALLARRLPGMAFLSRLLDGGRPHTSIASGLRRDSATGPPSINRQNPSDNTPDPTLRGGRKLTTTSPDMSRTNASAPRRVSRRGRPRTDRSLAWECAAHHAHAREVSWVHCGEKRARHEPLRPGSLWRDGPMRGALAPARDACGPRGDGIKAVRAVLASSHAAAASVPCARRHFLAPVGRRNERR